MYKLTLAKVASIHLQLIDTPLTLMVPEDDYYPELREHDLLTTTISFTFLTSQCTRPEILPINIFDLHGSS